MELYQHARQDDVLHLSLSGRLDVVGMQEVDDEFLRLTHSGRPTVVDLSEVEFIASLGIGLLFRAAKSLSQNGRKLVLYKPQGMVAGVLRSSRMDQVMPLADEFDEAIRLSKAA